MEVKVGVNSFHSWELSVAYRTIVLGSLLYRPANSLAYFLREAHNSSFYFII